MCGYTNFCIIVIGLCFLSALPQVLTVHISALHVPRGASHEAPLDCKYDLEDYQLYDVKWYKDGMQFFRCLPTGEVQVYPVDGVKVFHTGYASIGSCSLTLMALNIKSAGEYKCEVSTEGPHFLTAVQSSKLKIIESSRRTQSLNAVKNNSYEEKTTTVPSIQNIYSSKGTKWSAASYSILLLQICIFFTE